MDVPSRNTMYNIPILELRHLTCMMARELKPLSLRAEDLDKKDGCRL